MSDDFQAFWAAYPRREAKFNAMKAYEKARRFASAEDILAGVERYKQHMPDEKQYRPLPASFLNAGRWMDEYEDQPRQTRGALTYSADFANWCQHQPKCNSRDWHAVLIAKERGETA